MLESGTFFRPQVSEVYEMAGILLVEIYERVGKSFISVGKKVQKG